MDKTFFQKLKDTLGSAVYQEAQKSATDAFIHIASILSGRSTNTRQFMSQHKDRLKSRVTPQMLGRMCMYYYDPKTKEKLPYYDMFPMIIPIELYKDGFLGMNLHYLPPSYRAVLLDQLYTNIIRNRHLDEKKRIQISYTVVTGMSTNQFYVPCIKRYLYKHLRSRVYMPLPEDWNIALFLPVERFVKRNKRYVWNESVRKVRRSTYGT
jgi:hypothetical protein